MGGGEQGAVEGEVGLHRVGGVGAARSHRVHGGVQGGEVGVGAPPGGQAYGRRFDDGAHLGEVAQQRAVGVGGAEAVELPAQHVGVEQIPVRTVPYEGAALLTGVDHPLGGQYLQRLAQGGEADVQFALQGDQVQGGSFGDLAAQDAAGEGLHGLAVHAATGVRRHVVVPFCCELIAVVMRRT